MKRSEVRALETAAKRSSVLREATKFIEPRNRRMRTPVRATDRLAHGPQKVEMALVANRGIVVLPTVLPN